MRVVLCTQWFPPEKAALLSDIAEGLVERGHDVTVITGFPNYPTGRVYDGWTQRPWTDSLADGYRVRRVLQYPSHDSSAARRAASYVSFGLAATLFGWRQLRRADVVYVYHPPLTTAGGPWLSRVFGGAPYVLHVQDLWPDSVVASEMLEPRSQSAVVRLISRVCDAVYQRAAAIICIAPTMRSMLEERGIPAGKLEVVGNWADESVFQPVLRDPAVRSSLGLSDTTTVMFAGNLGPVQALDTAVRAAARMTDVPDFRLVLVGDGVARSSLEELASALGAWNVFFLGSKPLEEMNAITAAADAQLVSLQDRPFLRGTIPSKLGSVMASGLPVVCAVNGDARAVVEDAGSGWVCESENVDDLERAFRETHAASSDERRRRGDAGRRYYERAMARAAGVARIEQILVQVATESAGRGRRSSLTNSLPASESRRTPA